MYFMKQIHNRKGLRLYGYDYSMAGYYFITICAQNRKCMFGKIHNGQMFANDAGILVENIWNKLPQRFPNIELDVFIVMPNHFHGIIAIMDNDVGAIHELPLHSRTTRRRMLLPKIIGYFKMNTAKQINSIHGTYGKIWQRNYYDHIIRNENDLNRIREYIINNPNKWNTDTNNINGG